MRCLACNEILTEFESTIKYTTSGKFLDLCGKCRSYVTNSLDTTERYDLFDPDHDVVESDVYEASEEKRPALSSEDDAADGEV